MLRLPITKRLTTRILTHQSLLPQTRLLSTTPSLSKGDQNSTPGWSGRPTDDHVVHRKDGNDVQSHSSQTAMSDKESGKEGSGAISQKDETGATKKAKEEFPEAPKGPVIGMNDERGGKGH